jgi:hypothetical protein
MVGFSMKLEKAKIIRVKKGYNPNCSSGMWFFGYLALYGFVAILTQLVIGVVVANFLYKRHIKKYNLSNEYMDSFQLEKIKAKTEM